MTHPHSPRKRFGQNFLHDRHVVQKIIQAIAAKQTDNVVEIGPGLGVLTKELLPKLNTLDVVEIDRDLIDPLKKTCEPLGNLNIHQADALSFDFAQLAQGKETLRIVGNLPYNISTPLLFHLLTYIDLIQDMHFMLQKEVVNRLAAVPNTKAYGRLTIMIQCHCDVEPLFDVPPNAFTPAPKLNSSIVRLTPHKNPTYALKNKQHFETLVRQAFNQRRKTLRNCLKGLVTDPQLKALNINPTQRPEQLSIQDFINLSNSLS